MLNLISSFVNAFRALPSHVLSGVFYATSMLGTVYREPQREFAVKIICHLLKRLNIFTDEHLNGIYNPIEGQEFYPEDISTDIVRTVGTATFISAQRIIEKYPHIITRHWMAAFIEKSNLIERNGGSICLYTESTLKTYETVPKRMFRLAVSRYPHLRYERFFKKEYAFDIVYFTVKGAETLFRASGYANLPKWHTQEKDITFSKDDKDEAIKVLKKIEKDARQCNNTYLEKGCIVLRLCIEDKDSDEIAEKSLVGKKHFSTYRNAARKRLATQGYYFDDEIIPLRYGPRTDLNIK